MISRRDFLRTVGGASLLGLGMGCSGSSDKPEEPSKPVNVSATVVARCEGHEKRILALATSPDGKQVVSGGEDGTVRFWNTSDCKLVRKIQAIDPKVKWGGVNSLAWSPDGKTVGAALLLPDAHRLALWDAATGKEVEHNISYEKGFALSFTDDNSTLGIAGEGVQLWDYRRSKQLKHYRFGGEKERVVRLGFSPNGAFLAAAQTYFGEKQDRYPALVRVWDLKAGREILSGWEQSHEAVALVLSPDSSFLAAGGVNDEDRKKGLIHLWDLAKARPRCQLDQADTVQSLAFVLGGDILLSGGYGGGIHAWDWRNKALVATFKEHTEAVRCLTTTKDGTIAASAGRDKTLLIWRLERK